MRFDAEAMVFSYLFHESYMPDHRSFLLHQRTGKNTAAKDGHSWRTAIPSPLQIPATRRILATLGTP